MRGRRRPEPPGRRPPEAARIVFAALAAFAAASAGLATAAAEPPVPRLVFHPTAGSAHPGTLSVLGLRPEDVERLAQRGPDAGEWEALLAVQTELAARRGGQPAVLGSHEAKGGEIRFRPRFPFQPGLAYRARFDGALFDALSGRDRSTLPPTPDLEITFTPAAPVGEPATVVQAVYPTGPEVPANLLRLYVHFSAPVWPKDVADHVRLLDAAGREVALPFVEVEHGLWDAAGRRLTLFFHPGRVKREVGPNRALGPPLEEGQTYRLVIGAEILDARGRRLACRSQLAADPDEECRPGRAFEHVLRAGPADRASPDPARWRLTPPAGPGEPLTVDLPEPLDHALLERLLTVHAAAGRRLAGTAAVSQGERRWSFRPARPWSPGPHTLRVDPALEDLAGNSLHRLFEEELSAEPAGPSGPPGSRPRQRADPPGPVEIAFTVAGS